MLSRSDALAAGSYAALVAAYVGLVYERERSAPPGTDASGDAALAVVALVAVALGLAVPRWWTIAVPFVALPLGAAAGVAASLDAGMDEPGSSWIALGGVVSYVACPAAALGVVAAKLGGRARARRGRRREGQG